MCIRDRHLQAVGARAVPQQGLVGPHEADRRQVRGQAPRQGSAHEEDGRQDAPLRDRSVKRAGLRGIKATGQRWGHTRSEHGRECGCVRSSWQRRADAPNSRSMLLLDVRRDMVAGYIVRKSRYFAPVLSGCRVQTEGARLGHHDIGAERAREGTGRSGVLRSIRSASFLLLSPSSS